MATAVPMLAHVIDALADQADAVHEHGIAEQLRTTADQQTPSSLAYAMHVIAYATAEPDTSRPGCDEGTCAAARFTAT